MSETAKFENIAKVLGEALPYIRRFKGQTIVIKYGGAAMKENRLKRGFARDIVLLKLVGMFPIIVHGGGPQIGAVLQKLGKESTFINGMRVTDDQTMEVVEMVLGATINKEIVSLINQQGGLAVGITGKDAELIHARKMLIANKSSFQNEGDIDTITDDANKIDLGRVGEVTKINTKILDLLRNSDMIPVIAPIGMDDQGQAFNINADLVAGHIAAALGAQKLMLLTDTPGIKGRENRYVSQLARSQAQSLLEENIISGGMVPKINCALNALNAGIQTATILDGRVDHAVLLEIFTSAGLGTMITND